MTIDLRVGSRPVIIQGIRPSVDGGKWPVKREIGDHLTVAAKVFKEGHGVLRAVLRLRADEREPWREVPMHLDDPGLDRWSASAPLDRLGRWQYTVAAWEDRFASWARDTRKKVEAAQDVAAEVVEARHMLDAAVSRMQAAAAEADAILASSIFSRFEQADGEAEQAGVFLSPVTLSLMERWSDRSFEVVFEPALEAIVEPVYARFASWYEMFPRSQGTDPDRSATFDDCIARLPEIADLGFDVLYLVPVHPIGETYRKGRNNTFPAEPGEPGSPYAIGSRLGGHKAVHPDLGTLEDFRRLVAEAGRFGMRVALDIAIQCSRDHPWIAEHPEWFEFRPDGSIRFAENPPKKYEDIVNVNFYGDHWEALWQELLSVFLFWCDQGVRIFRVDNPHTKPVPFWEWAIREVKQRHPDAVFLAEAFTRPPMLKMLAKVGFSQSYTYFTWRNLKGELTDYLGELVLTDTAEYLRPNFFTCTPDILPEFLQRGGRPAFMIRAVLAATLSSLYGIYNSFELCENAALPGKEEYLDSEKYQYKVWDWDRPGNIKDLIRALNRIRRDNSALHELRNLRFHDADNDNVLFYSKTSFDRANMVFVAVNLDPFEAHEAALEFPLDRIGVGADGSFAVEDLLSGTRRLWKGSRHSVRLDPTVSPAAIWRVTPWKPVMFRDPYY